MRPDTAWVAYFDNYGELQRPFRQQVPQPAFERLRNLVKSFQRIAGLMFVTFGLPDIAARNIQHVGKLRLRNAERDSSLLYFFDRVAVDGGNWFHE